MVFLNVNILLPLLASLTVLAAPADNKKSSFTSVDDLSPLATDLDSENTTPTTISADGVDKFTPYTYFASAGYCDPSVTKTWTCGTNCDGNPGFEPIDSGGDGSDTQFWFVGYDPSLDTIIVVHQGTVASKILPLITDANVVLSSLDPSLFPNVPSSIEVHDGFKNAHEKAANDILSAVTTGIDTYGTNSVTTVGHSLGAAISLLDAVYLPLHISGLSIKFFGYGLPRVGNQDFVNYVDSQLNRRFARITNLKDPVPILPGLLLGYRHPSGEAHINDGNVWTWCPGQDNSNANCSVGAVPNVLVSDVGNHDGPYNGVETRC